MSENAASKGKATFRGDLSATPLPEILVTLHRYRVPGVVECLRGEELKHVYIDQGNIIFASSNRTEDSLGDRLLAAGRITREQYAKSVELLAQGGKRQGAILVEMGALAPKDLFMSVRDQVHAIVQSLFRWDSGTVTFVPGREKHTEFIKLEIPIPRAVLHGVREMEDAKRLLERIGSRITVLRRNDERDLRNLQLSAEELELLSCVDGRKTLESLVSDCTLTPAENARLLYGFYALGVITPKPSSQIRVRLKTRAQDDDQ